VSDERIDPQEREAKEARARVLAIRGVLEREGISGAIAARLALSVNDTLTRRDEYSKQREEELERQVVDAHEREANARRRVSVCMKCGHAQEMLTMGETVERAQWITDLEQREGETAHIGELLEQPGAAEAELQRVMPRLDPEVMRAAKKARRVAAARGVGDPMEAAIRAADRQRRLKEERVRCNCDDGLVENGPPGATYSAPCTRCGGSAWVVRLASDWRPVERPS
jgi:hypothetical protein